MYKDIGRRGTGKTTRLLKKALEDGCDIAVANSRQMETLVAIAAVDLGYRPSKHGREAFVNDVLIAPITTFAAGRCNDRKRPVLVDEIGLCMSAILGNVFVGYTEGIY